MKRLHRVTLTLSDLERKFLCSIVDAKGSDQIKHLLSILLEGKITSDLRASNLIYGTKPDSRFSHLKSDMLAFLEQVILLDLGRPGLSSWSKSRDKLLRTVKLIPRLCSRGLSDLAKDQLRGAINKLQSSEDSHYSVLERLFAVRVMVQSFGSDTTLSDFIEESIECALEDLKTLEHEFHQRLDLKRLNEGVNQITHCPHDIHKLQIKSPDFRNFFSKSLWVKAQIVRLRKEGKYSELLEILHGYNSNICSNKMTPRAELNGVSTAIVNCHLMLGDFDVASELLSEMRFDSAKLPLEGPMQTLWTLARTQLARDEEPDARLLTALERLSTNEQEQQRDIAELLLIAFEFNSGRLIDGVNRLSELSYLFTDRYGFRTSMKLMEIQILIEERNYPLCSNRAESFRKHSYHLNAGDHKRIHCIVRLCRLLIESAFDFNLVATKHADDLALLRSGEGEYFWDPLGYEIIRFDEWFDRKVAEQNKKGRRRNSVKRRLKVSGA